MTHRVFKYPLPSGSEVVEVMMPSGAQVLCVAKQGDSICVWAKVLPHATPSLRQFRIVVTGQDIGPNCGLYIGTIHSADGWGNPFVLHVFEVLS